MRTKRISRPPKELRVFLAGFLPAALAIAVWLVCRGRPDFAGSVTKNFSEPLRAFMGAVTSILPFPLMELTYLAAGIFLLGWLVSLVVVLIRKKGRVKTLLRRFGVLLVLCAWILAGYGWLWGLEYDAPGFSEESGLAAEPISTEELTAAAAYFLEQANALSARMPRDGDGHFAVPADEILSRWEGVYDALREEYPCLDGRLRQPKGMLFNRVISRLGFTGFYFALTGESNVNVDSPAFLLGAVAAHELGHQLGYPDEAECNFLGITACVTARDEVYRYAGYCDGLLYLMNALYKADRDAWSELRDAYGDELNTDWADNNAYWSSMETKVTKTSEKVYDSYLRANGDERGVRSYGACVDLLVAWCKTHDLV